MNKWLKLSIKLVITIGVIGLLIYKVGFKKIIETLATSNLWLLPLVIAIALFSIYISSVSLWLITDINKRIKSWKFYQYYLYTTYSSYLTPGKVGQFLIIYYLKKEGYSIGETTGILLVNKLMAVFISGIIAIIGFTFFFGLANSIILICLLMIGIIVSYLLFFNERGRALIKRFVPKRFTTLFTSFSSTIERITRTRKSILITSFILLASTHIINGVWVSLIFNSVGASVAIWPIIAIGAMELFATRIPITIGGLGIREGLGIYLFGLFGIAPEIVFSRYVVGITIRYLISGLVILLLKTNITADDTKKLAMEIKTSVQKQQEQ